MPIAIPHQPSPIRRPTESELMELARLNLARRISEAPAIRHPAAQTMAPAAPILTPEQQERRTRSLRACHLPSLYERPRHEPPKDSGAYVPAAAARLDDDMNLTDGARRCARKILEETYRHDREGRKLQVTVSYLARGLRRSARTIQRYLRMLEREGYVRIEVVAGHRSRLCIGLVIHLLTPLFPRHHRESWPASRRKPGATNSSENKKHKYLYSYNPRFRALHDPRCRTYARETWAEKCLEGVFRSLMKVRVPLLRAMQAAFETEDNISTPNGCAAAGA